MPRPLIAVAVLVALLLPEPADADGIQIIANPSVDVHGPLSLDQIAALYLLRTTLWPDGSHVVPVNREATADIRAMFTASVLRQDRASLATYWNMMHFIGKQPPLIQESEQAMLAFVQRVPGAVGYVDASTNAVNVRVLGRVP